MPEQPNPEQQLEILKELRKKYEAVLADAQKTGDYSEAQKLKQELDERLTALEALFPKQESKKDSPEYLDTKFEEKALVELDKYFRLGVNHYEIARNLACFNSDKALELRKELVKGEENYTAIFEGLAGVDNEGSWRFRDSFNFNQYPHSLLTSIGGLDSKRAWDLRIKILGLGSVDIDQSIALSLIGLDTKQAWEFRDDLFKRYGDNDLICYELLKSLAGIDTKQAWEMRMDLYTAHSNLRGLLTSFTGMNNDEAWRYRDKALNRINSPGFVEFQSEYEPILARSLAGIDSQRAWDAREQWGKLGKFDLVAKSLAGLDHSRVWEMRQRMEADIKRMKLGMLDLVDSLNGGYITAIGWRTAKKYNKERDI